MTFNTKDEQVEEHCRVVSPHGLRPQSRLQALDGFVPLLLVLLLQREENLSLEGKKTTWLAAVAMRRESILISLHHNAKRAGAI